MSVLVIKKEGGLRLRNPASRDNDRREIEVEHEEISALIAELMQAQKEVQPA